MSEIHFQTPFHLNLSPDKFLFNKRSLADVPDTVLGATDIHTKKEEHGLVEGRKATQYLLCSVISAIST